MPARLTELLKDARVVGVLRADSPETAVQAALAAVRGGLRAVELTFTTPEAELALETLFEQLPEGVLLGAGSVMTVAQAEAAVRSGASFLVSPHLGLEVLRAARRMGVPYVPGVLTPTEVVTALAEGASMLKLFPIGSSGGVSYLKDLLGPLPDLRAMVTGGVSPAEVGAYLRAGALAVGLGSNLFPKEAMRKGDWDAVEAATRAALAEASLERGAA